MTEPDDVDDAEFDVDQRDSRDKRRRRPRPGAVAARRVYESPYVDDGDGYE